MQIRRAGRLSQGPLPPANSYLGAPLRPRFAALDSEEAPPLGKRGDGTCETDGRLEELRQPLLGIESGTAEAGYFNPRRIMNYGLKLGIGVSGEFFASPRACGFVEWWDR